MAIRNYKNNAPNTSLLAGIAAADTTLSVDDAAGFPAPPFTATIDRNKAAEEVILVTDAVGNTFTATRGFDGTLAQEHTVAAVLEHVAAAIDYREANAHVNATSAHGTTGDVVGEDSTQTLTNKTLDGPAITGQATFTPDAGGKALKVVKGGVDKLSIDDTGTVVTTGDANIAGATTISGALTVGGKTTAKGADFDGSVSLTGDLSASGDADVTGNVNVGGALDVTGATTATDVEIASGLTVNGDTTLAGVKVVGDSNLSGGVVIDGSVSSTGAITAPNIHNVYAECVRDSVATVGGAAATPFTEDGIFTSFESEGNIEATDTGINIKESGRYLISVRSVLLGGSSPTRFIVGVWKNGVIDSASNTGLVTPNGSFVSATVQMKCTTGDKVTLFVFPDVSSSVRSSSVTVERVG